MEHDLAVCLRAWRDRLDPAWTIAAADPLARALLVDAEAPAGPGASGLQRIGA